MKQGILIMGYGTRKGNLVEVLEAQAARLRAMTDYEVAVGYFRVSSPTLMEALESLVDKGVERIALVPYYVAEGKLTHFMMPEKIGMPGYAEYAQLEVKGRKVEVYKAQAFDFDPVVTDIICDRIAGMGGTKDSGIMVLGHGTLDESLMNRAVIQRNAERLSARGYRHVAFAFNEFCGPSIRDAMAKLVGEGVKEIVCIPLFIAMGLHLGDEIPEQLGIPAYSEGGEVEFEGKKIRIKYTRPLEDDPRLAELVLRKAAEYLERFPCAFSSWMRPTAGRSSPAGTSAPETRSPSPTCTRSPRPSSGRRWNPSASGSSSAPPRATSTS